MTIEDENISCRIPMQSFKSWRQGIKTDLEREDNNWN